MALSGIKMALLAVAMFFFLSLLPSATARSIGAQSQHGSLALGRQLSNITARNSSAMNNVLVDIDGVDYTPPINDDEIDFIFQFHNDGPGARNPDHQMIQLNAPNPNGEGRITREVQMPCTIHGEMHGDGDFWQLVQFEVLDAPVLVHLGNYCKQWPLLENQDRVGWRYDNMWMSYKGKFYNVPECYTQNFGCGIDGCRSRAWCEYIEE